MSEYRDDLQAARQRNETIEAQLKARDAQLEARDTELAELRSALERAERRTVHKPQARSGSTRYVLLGVAAVAVLVTLALLLVLVRAGGADATAVAQPAVIAQPAVTAVATDPARGNDVPLTVPVAQLTHEVPFELGAVEMGGGDEITIREIMGDRPRLEVGGNYVVRGRYKLVTRAKGSLQLLVTAKEAADGVGNVQPTAIVEVQRGEGDFELRKHLRWDGYPHLTLYDPATGKPFAGIYFGTGAMLLKDKSWSDKEPPPAD